MSFIALHREIDIAYTLDAVLHFMDHNSIYKIGRIVCTFAIDTPTISHSSVSREIPKSTSRKPFFPRHASPADIARPL